MISSFLSNLLIGGSEVSNNLPGRLGNPAETLISDERTDPRIKASFEQAEAAMASMSSIVDAMTSLQLGENPTREELLNYCSAFEKIASAEHPAMWEAMPEYPDVITSEQIIKGPEGNDIRLYLHKPRNKNVKVPCVVHTHGGGMVILTAADPMFVRWRNTLACLGMVVVGVEFRNGGGELGNHPFPAGLEDCSSGIKWVHEKRDELGVSKIVVSGESGGGNLSIATALKAKREGWLNAIDGIYACCPYISGTYAAPPSDLPSLLENDGYVLNIESMSHLVKVYDPNEEHGSNPLAWPLQASLQDLRGLPPHVISMNELDPLRDEGCAYHRKLLQAGVSSVGRIVLGTPHAADVAYEDVIPDIYRETARSLFGFANSL